MKFVECKGTPEQIGEAVGESLREEIQQYADIASEKIPPGLNSRLPVFRKVLIETQPDVYREIQGMARASLLDEADILKFNMEAYPNSLGVDHQECSNIAFSGGPDGPIWGKNNDGSPPHWPVYVKKIIPEHGIPIIAFSFAGLVFVSDAMNAEGVAVGHSSVGSLLDKSDLHPNIRLWCYHCLLKARTTREFVQLMASIPLRGKGYTHVVVDKSGDVCSIEAACPLIQVREKKHKTGVNCVNHYQLPLLRDLDWRTPEGKVNSIKRMEYLNSVLESDEAFDIEHMKSVLRYHGKPASICRHGKNVDGSFGDGSYTEYSMIGLPAQGKMLYLHGNPCEHEYSLITF